MVDAGADYTLTANDRTAFFTLLRAETALGPARPSPGQAQFWECFAAIDTLAYGQYASVTNPLVKGWLDTLFAALVQTRTCYGIAAAGLYVLYAYAQFMATCYPGDQWSQQGVPTLRCMHEKFPFEWAQRGGRVPTFDLTKGLRSVTPWQFFAEGMTLWGETALAGLWRPPAAPAGFFAALMADINTLNDALHAAGGSTAAVALLQAWGGPPLAGAYPDAASVVRFEQSRFDPAHWTDAGTFLHNLAPLWRAQHAAMTALLQPATLTADAYFFFLHLLLALPTGTATSQQFAQRLVSASAPSREYPNDTFANQLVYLVLMHLADPDGPYAWDNPQLQATLHELEGAILASDPASAAITASLVHHGRVLHTDASYPLQDPYSAVPFTQRKTDTLFALDKARHGLRQ